MSLSHLLILGIIAVLVIPPEKLPEVARQAAKFLADMRRMTTGIFDDLKQDVVLTPEEMMKKKAPYVPPSEAIVLEPVVAKTPEEIKLAEEEYLKQIQPDPMVVLPEEKKPTS